GKEIGRWRSWPYGVKTSPGLIALPYLYSVDEIAFDGPDGGVAIWSEKSQRWQTISLWAESLTGWTKEAGLVGHRHELGHLSVRERCRVLPGHWFGSDRPGFVHVFPTPMALGAGLLTPPLRRPQVSNLLGQ